jgi:YesN/AraC family two-component response regulator
MARILIVDDSIVMRKNLEVILSNVGHEIVGQATNGKQAVLMYSELKPDLVTMDISMPLMSGVDAVKEITDTDEAAKIIIISALNQKQMVFEALNNGAKHYIIKPIDPNKVIGVVNEVLSEENKDEVSSVNIDKENISQIPGFKIQNNEGKFNITFNENIGVKDVAGLETAINGLLFISPLNIVFDFGTVLDISDDVLRVVLRLAGKIKDVSGNLELRAGTKELEEKLK